MGEGKHFPKVEIHALARDTAPGRLRMWVGVFDKTEPKALTWTIESPASGNSARSVEVGVETVRELAAMSPGPPDVLTRSGVYDLILPDRALGANDRPEYTVQAHVTWSGNRTADSAKLRVRPLPKEIPTGFNSSFNVMLVSCFYENADSVGRAGFLAKMLAHGMGRPDLVLTVGDQVYLDVPPIGSIKITEKSFARLFEKKYRKNWQTAHGAAGYADVLRAAPVAGIPDDHEFWNNYPEGGYLWPSTWMRFTRENWEEAARNAYNAFQHGGDPNDKNAYCYSFDVTPLSFFMLDNRTFRTGTLKSMHSMRDDDLLAYNRWVRRMLETPASVPVLVTGPSLFQAPKTQHLRNDLNFANVSEYPAIMDGLIRLSQAGRTPLALTGDVHYPRLAHASFKPGSQTRPWAPIYEVIASPASLVMGAPQGPSKPEKLDTFTLDTQLKLRLDCTKKWPPKGHELVHDHVAILKFTRMDTGVKLSVRYWLVPHSSKRPRFYTAPQVNLLYAAEANAAPAAHLLPDTGSEPAASAPHPLEAP